MGRPLLLDCFAGAGGCARGYTEAGFDVVGVDIAPQPRYLLSGAVEFHQGDALEFIRQHGHEFDVIHASPPCQAYCYLSAIHRKTSSHPRLIEPVRELLGATGRPWVIENVEPAPLIHPARLCGSAFGLRVRRHRLFEGSMLLFSSHCQHREQGRSVGVYGHQGSGSLRQHKNGGPFIRAKNVEDAGDAMGIDWMTWREMTQAIPPAYCKHIGSQLLAAIERRAVA